MRARTTKLAMVSCLAIAAAGCGPWAPGAPERDGGDGGTPGADARPATPPDPACPRFEMVAPLADAVLGPSAGHGGRCDDGLVYDVALRTDAARGTRLELWVDHAMAARAVVADGAASYPGVALGASGAHRIEVRQDGARASCLDYAIRVDCRVPTCEIVPPGGGSIEVPFDAPTGDHRAAVTVRTTVEDGQPVELSVDGVALSAQRAAGGLATFADVALPGDTISRLTARCTNLAHTTAVAAPRDVSVHRGAYAGPDPRALSFVSPRDATEYGPARDADPNLAGFQLDGVALATDAADGLPVRLWLGAGLPYTGTARGGRVLFGRVTLAAAPGPIELRAAVALPDHVAATASIHVALDDAPPSAPGHPEVDAVSERPGDARLTWLEASDPTDAGSRRVRGYEIRVATAAITEASFARGAPAVYPMPGGEPGDRAALVIHGLASGVPYYFAVRAIDAGGNAGPLVATREPLTL